MIFAKSDKDFSHSLAILKGEARKALKNEIQQKEQC